MSNDYTYGGPQEVADRLMHASDVDQGDLTGALINALRRIASLEREVEELKANAPQA